MQPGARESTRRPRRRFSPAALTRSTPSASASGPPRWPAGWGVPAEPGCPVEPQRVAPSARGSAPGSPEPAGEHHPLGPCPAQLRTTGWRKRRSISACNTPTRALSTSWSHRWDRPTDTKRPHLCRPLDPVLDGLPCSARPVGAGRGVNTGTPGTSRTARGTWKRTACMPGAAPSRTPRQPRATRGVARGRVQMRLRPSRGQHASGFAGGLQGTIHAPRPAPGSRGAPQPA